MIQTVLIPRVHFSHCITKGTFLVENYRTTGEKCDFVLRAVDQHNKAPALLLSTWQNILARESC